MDRAKYGGSTLNFSASDRQTLRVKYGGSLKINHSNMFWSREDNMEVGLYWQGVYGPANIFNMGGRI